MYRHPRVAHAYPLPPLVLHHPLGRPVRLAVSSDSVATRQVAGATQRPLYRRETPLCDRPTGLSRKPAGAPRRGTCRVYCRGYVLRPANQLRTLVRFTDQKAAAGMRNGRSHSRSQMRIDTSRDVAKLAVTLAQGRVLAPERGFNPFTRSIFQNLKLDGSRRSASDPARRGRSSGRPARRHACPAGCKCCEGRQAHCRASRRGTGPVSAPGIRSIR